MSEKIEADDLQQAIYMQGYAQGWRHSQEAMSVWLTELGTMTDVMHIQLFGIDLKDKANFYKLLGGIAGALKTDQEDLLNNNQSDKPAE